MSSSFTLGPVAQCKVAFRLEEEPTRKQEKSYWMHAKEKRR